MLLKLVGTAINRSLEAYFEILNNDDITVIVTMDSATCQKNRKELIEVCEEVLRNGTMQPIFLICLSRHTPDMVSKVHREVAGPAVVIGEGPNGLGFFRFPDHIAYREALKEAKIIMSLRSELSLDVAMELGVYAAKLPVVARRLVDCSQPAEASV